MGTNKEEIVVQCVFGEADLRHISEVLIPSLLESTTSHVVLALKNFNGSTYPSLPMRNEGRLRLVTAPRAINETSGFAQNHNELFRLAGGAAEYFVIINPDCIAMPGSIDSLVQTFENSKGRIGIVEGRQWPFEHPKEFKIDTKHTPWASGAFALISSNFYKEVDGMDENYFLYTEDVDLSWRAWLQGYEVLYERTAEVVHFTGGAFYDEDQVEVEKFYSLRNFLYISHKFFGAAGLTTAKRQMHLTLPKQFVNEIFRAFREMPNRSQTFKFGHLKRHRQVKITGVNLYHELRAK